MPEKPKLAMYWASSCGGCEISVVNLHEKLLELDAHFDFFFCPCLLDTKVEDLRALPDGGLAVTWFNGAIRTEENEAMARLLRAKSQLLIAYGACAASGGIPALSNLHCRAEHMRSIYLDGPTLDNAAGVVPQVRTEMAEGTLELPAFFATVKTLAQVVEVDFFLPGCPPEPHQIWGVVQALIQGAPLPAKGSTLGGGRSTVCQECARTRQDKAVKKFYRSYEIELDRETCLLEQGLVCMGVATRDGCGALCPQVNMPCTGCYGAPEGVLHQGAKMIAAVGSVLDVGAYAGLSEADAADKTDAILDTLPDLAGTFSRYTLGTSNSRRAK
jgi:F420-non-reducing hydrogenase small subunit